MKCSYIFISLRIIKLKINSYLPISIYHKSIFSDQTKVCLNLVKHQLYCKTGAIDICY